MNMTKVSDGLTKNQRVEKVNKKDNYWLWLTLGVLAIVIASAGNLITQ